MECLWEWMTWDYHEANKRCYKYICHKRAKLHVSPFLFMEPSEMSQYLPIREEFVRSYYFQKELIITLRLKRKCSCGIECDVPYAHRGTWWRRVFLFWELIALPMCRFSVTSKEKKIVAGQFHQLLFVLSVCEFIIRLMVPGVTNGIFHRIRTTEDPEEPQQSWERTTLEESHYLISFHF